MRSAPQEQQSRRTPIEIVYGMPSRNCERVGICRIEFSGAPEAYCRQCDQRTRGMLRYAPELNRLGIEIPLNDLTDQV